MTCTLSARVGMRGRLAALLILQVRYVNAYLTARAAMFDSTHAALSGTLGACVETLG